jgi:hypothetical protein
MRQDYCAAAEQIRVPVAMTILGGLQASDAVKAALADRIF